MNGWHYVEQANERRKKEGKLVQGEGRKARKARPHENAPSGRGCPNNAVAEDGESQVELKAMAEIG